MGKAVDSPCYIKGEGVTERITYKESITYAFIPKVTRYCNWHNDTENYTEELVVPG